MIALIILAAFAALVLTLAFVRVGVDAEYANGDMTVSAKAAFLRFKVYPRRRDERKAKKRAKKGQAAEKVDIRGVARSAVRVLTKLRRKVLIKQLTVAHIAGGRDNPSSAAVTYGALTAALGVTQEVLESAFKVRRYDLYANVNFNARETSVYVRAALSIAVWEIIYIAFGELSVKQQDAKITETEETPSVKHKSRTKRK